MKFTGLSQPGHLVRALKGHIKSFLLKDAHATTLAEGVRTAAAGKHIIDPELLIGALQRVSVY